MIIFEIVNPYLKIYYDFAVIFLTGLLFIIIVLWLISKLKNKNKDTSIVIEYCMDFNNSEPKNNIIYSDVKEIVAMPSKPLVNIEIQEVKENIMIKKTISNEELIKQQGLIRFDGFFPEQKKEVKRDIIVKESRITSIECPKCKAKLMSHSKVCFMCGEKISE